MGARGDGGSVRDAETLTPLALISQSTLDHSGMNVGLRFAVVPVADIRLGQLHSRLNARHGHHDGQDAEHRCQRRQYSR